MDEPPRGAVAFRWAAVADKFHLAPAQIAALTDYQIDALLFHPRDRDGGLTPPAAPGGPKPKPTRESRLLAVAQLESMRVISPQRANEMRAEVEARYGSE